MVVRDLLDSCYFFIFFQFSANVYFNCLSGVIMDDVLSEVKGWQGIAPSHFYSCL